MPDVSGWSKADLVKLGSILDIKVKFNGSGYCVNQSIQPYETLTDKKSITFTLKEND